MGVLFKPSLLKQSSLSLLISPSSTPPSSPCRPANPAYRHPLTGTWGRTGWWTCLTQIGVGARDVCLCERPLRSARHGSNSAACARNQWLGVKMRPEIGVIDSSSYDAAFIDAVWFALLSFFDPPAFRNGHVYRLPAVCVCVCVCVCGPLWGKNKFSVGQATRVNCEPPQPLTRFPPSPHSLPPLALSSFPRSISSTISPRRRRRIWSMVAPSPNAPSRASGGSNGMSD